MKLTDRIEYETDQGMYTTTRLERMLRDIPNSAEGGNCSYCGRHAQLFFGDPDGDNWCYVCQLLSETPEVIDILNPWGFNIPEEA